MAPGPVRCGWACTRVPFYAARYLVAYQIHPWKRRIRELGLEISHARAGSLPAGHFMPREIDLLIRSLFLCHEPIRTMAEGNRQSRRKMKRSRIFHCDVVHSFRVRVIFIFRSREIWRQRYDTSRDFIASENVKTENSQGRF